MKFREAMISDIPQLEIIRNSVKENVLFDPSLVTTEDYEDYLTKRGKGWVCEIDNNVIGFAIADLVDNNIWALFIHPDHEKKGIGHQLHRLMLNWYFSNGKETVWLSTAPNSRAEMFYKKSGWRSTAITKSGEIKFEMSAADWK